MPEIDYSKYLEGLNVQYVSPEERIKNYLEEQCQKDEALKALYSPEKIKDCYEFIYNAVKKMEHKNNCACVEDTIVFKMARDYFIDILPTLKEDTPAVDITSTKEAVKEVTEQIKEDAASDNVKRDYCGFEVYGEETEEPEEAAEEEPCDQEENKVEEKAIEPEETEPIRYDEDGQALLFDFM